MKNWVKLVLHLWRALGFIFVGFGFVLLLYSLMLGWTAASAISVLSPQTANSLFFATFTPLVLPASLCFVVGFTGVLTGRSIENYENPEESGSVLKRLNQLEYIVDNNFEVIKKKLETREEQQRRASQDTILKVRE
jgi:hypothetical protein